MHILVFSSLLRERSKGWRWWIFEQKENESEKFYVKRNHPRHSEPPQTFSGQFHNVSEELDEKIIAQSISDLLNVRSVSFLRG